MSAANRKPYLGEPVHYCLKEGQCRAATITAVVDVWGTRTGAALTVFPVGLPPKPARGVQFDSSNKTVDTWHFAH